MNLYFFLAVITLLCFGVQWTPLHDLFIWTRADIEHGQWWRILTGNLTHTNSAHLAMNIAGLWVVSWLFQPTVRVVASVLLLSSAVIGVALLATDLDYYLGLSGALHGLFAYCALHEWQNGRKSSAWLVLGIIAKVVWEQSMGASATTEALIGDSVAISAHLAGMLGGFSAALWQNKLKNPFLPK